MKIDARTSLYCIFGNPARHSLSPAMHNASFAHDGINAVYLAFEIASIGDAVAAMRSLPIMGASVTIPYKVAVLGSIDAVDPLAGAIGSVNTLVNDGTRIVGYNTDGDGAALALDRAGVGLDGASVLVIGNGGSARAIAHAIASRGARVTITGRNRSRIDDLSGSLEAHGYQAGAVLLGDLDQFFMDEVDIIINTTPVGMAPDSLSMPISEHLIRPDHVVFDIVYSPAETMLLKKSSERGCTTVRGAQMLLCQGALQYQIWTGRTAPFDVMKAALSRYISFDD